MQAAERSIRWRAGRWDCVITASIMLTPVPVLELRVSIPQGLMSDGNDEERAAYASGRSASIEALADLLADFLDQCAAGEAAHQQVH